jgi:Predicted Co/Zn/Cd cation transporters
MPLLAWAKLRVASPLQSAALRADAYETVTCAWLSLTTLIGLALNVWLGWSWADPMAALLLVPLIVREGLEGLRHEQCADD